VSDVLFITMFYTALAIFVLPIVAYFTVKLATFAYLKARHRFEGSLGQDQSSDCGELEEPQEGEE